MAFSIRKLHNIISARQSAPTDGRDPFGTAPNRGFYTSKQNSDASGLFYQWGRKDPFTFATSSESWGADSRSGKYPVKIYTIDGVLIYQENNGDDNKDKQPLGGIIYSSTLATSMMETIKKPTTFYGKEPDLAMINHNGHTRALWDYYWTSYSRGTDGRWGSVNKKYHSKYLDIYTPQRVKSIYDPCPYGFKVPSKGVYSTISYSSWIPGSYSGSRLLLGNQSWVSASGHRNLNSVGFADLGGLYTVLSSILESPTNSYFDYINSTGYLSDGVWTLSVGHSVRCIEDCDTLVNPPRPTEEIHL